MITIKLENFEGPLDLLLHLIEEKKMDIKEIKISNVIDEYLEIIRQHEKNNLKIKVEFLQMASFLIEIKSKSILRKDKKIDEEVNLEERLREYKLFKEFSKIFSENENEYYRSYSKTNDDNIENIIITHDNTSLTYKNLENCLNNLILKLISKKDKIKIEIDEEFGVNEAKELINHVENNKEILFIDLFKDKITKKRIVIVFLTILELYKQNKIDIVIHNNNFSIIKGKNV